MMTREIAHEALSREWVEANWAVLEAICNVPGMEWTREQYLADLPSKWSTSRIVRLGGDLVGYCVSSVRGQYLWIHRLVVDGQRRNLSIGREILLQYRSLATAVGLKGVLLKTPSSNAGAVRFYEREGFVRLADLGDHAVFRSDTGEGFAVGVHQPNYLPWLGYFYKIFLSDTFVFLDDVPVPKGSYTVRTKVLINDEAKWLTVPSSRALADEIRHSYPVGDWAKKHVKTLEGCYARAPFFKAHFPAIAEIMQRQRAASLADLNIYLIEHIASVLGMKRLFYRSSPFSLSRSADERLVDVVKLLHGNEYISGSGGANYQSEETFAAADISLQYTNFKPSPYSQKSENFVAGLSVVDALFNIGPGAIIEMFEAQAQQRVLAG